VKLKIKLVQFISKEYFFVNILLKSSFFLNYFGLFKNPAMKPANKEANASSPEAHPNVLVRPLRGPPIIGPVMAPTPCKEGLP